jgi:hypothetical protein
MGSFTVSDFVQQADQQTVRHDAQLTRFRALIDDTKQRRDELAARMQRAAVDLIAALLPNDDDASYRALAERFGAPEIAASYRRGQDRRAAIDARIAAIDADSRYHDRDTLRIRAQQQLDEVRPLYDIARQDLGRLSHVPGLDDLIARGYDTPSYAHQGWSRFLHADYLRDWKRADEIGAELRLGRFAEVATHYRDRQQQNEVLGRTVHELDAQLANIDALEAERRRLSAERDALPEWIRAEAGQALASLLRNNAALVPDGEGAESLRARVRLIDGLDHQVQYLDGVRMRAEQDAAELAERAERLRSERDRYAADPYRFRNKSFTQEQFDNRFGRDGRYSSAYDRYARASNSVYIYNDYNDAIGWELASGFLWWNVMTGGLNGSYIPEVQTYYADNPDFGFDRNPGGSGYDPGYDPGGGFAGNVS